MKKSLKELANIIFNCEIELQQGKNIKSNQQKIENIMSALSIEDIFELDHYIQDIEEGKD